MTTDNLKKIIAKEAAKEIKDGQIINLGVGIPTLIPDFIGEKLVFLQSENGLLGIGPTPDESNIDMDLISASKSPITMIAGASIFDSADSFAMIRGEHIDLAILGALQIDESGEVANWSVPRSGILGVGGAMDLMVGAKKIIITTTHLTKDGKPKLLKELTYPSSSKRKVEMVITEHAIFEFNHHKMYLKEIISDISLEKLTQITDANFSVNHAIHIKSF